MSYVEYDSNNSGGHWWLTDDDWKNLEAAGWVVEWVGLSPKYNAAGNYAERDADGIPVLVPFAESGARFNLGGESGRWRGALARKAYRAGLGLRQAADEWERITGKSATDAGCACCGQPHNFTEYDTAGKHVASGPKTHYEASWE